MKPRADNSQGLRLFHIVNSMEMGGSEHQMVEVACRQKARGILVEAGCLSKKGPLLERLQQAGIAVSEFDPKGGIHRPRGIYQLFRLSLFLARKRFDIVQSHDLYSTLLGVPAAWLARVPTILSSRRDLGHWWWYTPQHRKLLRHIQYLSKFVIANSQAVSDSLVRTDGFDPSRIRVIRNGVDFERFSGAPRSRAKLFPRLGSENKLVAVVANMNVDTKGHTDLVQAASLVCKKFPEARFLLVGDGPKRQSIEEMARELGLLENLVFLGRSEDVPAVLASCDLFVLPSWAEGLPNSVLEAMAAGLPIVATRVGGIPEMVDDGQSGLLVAPKDVPALARAILSILGDPGLAKRLGQAAQERARAEFSFDHLLAELDGLYYACLKATRARKPTQPAANGIV